MSIHGDLQSALVAMKVEADRYQGMCDRILATPHPTPEDKAAADSFRSLAASTRAIADRIVVATIHQQVRDAEAEIREAEMQSLYDSLQQEDAINDLRDQLDERRKARSGHAKASNGKRRKAAAAVATVATTRESLDAIHYPTAVQVGPSPSSLQRDSFQGTGFFMAPTASQGTAEEEDLDKLIEKETKALEDAQRVALALANPSQQKQQQQQQQQQPKRSQRLRGSSTVDDFGYNSGASEYGDGGYSEGGSLAPTHRQQREGRRGPDPDILRRIKEARKK